MPRKKKQTIEILEGAGANPDNNLVQKANPLVSLWQSDLTLPEFKILDVYLSRINSEKPNQRVVRFRKGELEDVLGVTKINRENLELRLKHLMGNVIKIEDDRKEKGFKMVTLFEEAAAWQDKNGLWTVDLQSTQSAMEYFFNVQNLGYLRYRLRCVMPLQSRYAYILFLFLERQRALSKRYKRPIIVEVDELKKILSCDKEETYNQFFRFRQQVLDRALKELHEKTEFQCTYETVKTGRKVTAINFILEELPESALPDAEDESQLAIEGYIDEREPFWVFGPLPWLTDAQAKEVKLLTLQVPIDKMPPEHNDNMELRGYEYLEMVQARLNRAKEQAANRGKPIKNEYAYLLKIIKGDIGE